MSESISLKAVSLLLALILWITILGFKREEVKKNVKLEPWLPPGIVITNKIPSHIQFTLSGPRVLLKDVEKKIQPIHPDLRNKTRESTIEYSISEDLIGEVPAGVRVTGFYPANVIMRLEEVIERYISVRPSLTGSPADGFEVSTIRSEPAKVAVSGPKSLLQDLEWVVTETFDVEALRGTKESVLSVEVDASQGLVLSREKAVRVKVTTRRISRRGTDEE